MPVIDFREELDKTKAVSRRREVLFTVAVFILSFVIIWLVRMSPVETGPAWECRDGEWVQLHPTVTLMPTDPCAGGQSVPETEEKWQGDVAYTESVSFLQKGRLIRGLPDMDPGKLYLAFDPHGVRTERIALAFDLRSVCAIGEELVPCTDPRIDSGLLVRVRGQRTQDYVMVLELETTSEESL